MKSYIAGLFASLLLVGCNQQAVADLAVCKSDLGKAQESLTAANAANAQKQAALEQELKTAKDHLASLQQAADAAAQAAKTEEDAKAQADKAKADAKAQAMKQDVAAKKAVLRQAVQNSDVKVMQPVQQMNTQEKAKAAGF